jgi:hypothetical protein
VENNILYFVEEREKIYDVVLFFLSGDSLASDFYVPTYTTYENGANRVFRNVGTKTSDARESPKRQNTTFRTRRNFEIKNL